VRSDLIELNSHGSHPSFLGMQPRNLTIFDCFFNKLFLKFPNQANGFAPFAWFFFPFLPASEQNRHLAKGNFPDWQKEFCKSIDKIIN
jgi:hypothetical protein